MPSNHGDTPDGEHEHRAAEQADRATDTGKVIVADSGFEQVPVQPYARVDTPLASSAPPAELQSGVPLPEGRAAGVQAGIPLTHAAFLHRAASCRTADSKRQRQASCATQEPDSLCV